MAKNLRLSRARGRRRQRTTMVVIILACCCQIFCHASKVAVLPKGKSHCSTASHLASRVYFSGGSAQRRWERMDGKMLGGMASNNGGETKNSFQQSLHSDFGVGRACNYYIWDVPSAMLHKWCHHLLKDCIYEGLGGRKFVRIEPGSILQLLYPCSRYSPDRCLVCGGTFRDHLTLWWANHLYTPFDRYLDQIYDAGVKLEPTFLYHLSSKPSRTKWSQMHTYKTEKPKYRKPKMSSKDKPIETTKLFAFHRQYVLDVETLVDGVTDKNERAKKLHKELSKVQNKAGRPMEMRMLTERNKAYVVPAAEYPASQKNKNGQQIPSATLQIARAIVLNAVDSLISMQEIENNRIRARQRNEGCCH